MLARRVILVSVTATLVVAAGIGVWSLCHHGSGVPASPSQHVSVSDFQHLPLHPTVAKIVKDGPTMPYLKFNYLIKEIPTNLAAHDIDALCAFISGPQPGTFLDGEWGSLVNDIEEALTVQTTPSEKVARALSAIYRDQNKSQLQRDYALQHIGGFAIYLVHAGSAESGKLSSSPIQHSTFNIQNFLLTELRHATSDPSKSYAGTALNLLDGILRAADSRSTVVSGLSAESLVALALPIAENPALSLNSRLPALQLLGRHRAPQAAPLARAILADSRSSILLVQASAAVLAQCGGSTDLPILEKLLATATPHTRPALDEALRAVNVKAETLKTEN